MTPAQLETAGRLLYGHNWRRAFEDQFGVSNRFLRRALKGEEDVPAGLMADVKAELHHRARGIRQILEKPA